MGTRGYQKVINEVGEVKIQQYNQWDSYPSGLGVEILNFLKTADLKKYKENLNKIPQATDEELTEVDKNKNWKELYPYLSRDCGGDIHNLILEGSVKFVQFIEEEEAKQWCEGFYTINFQTNELICEYHERTKTYSLSELPSEEQFLKDLENKDEE